MMDTVGMILVMCGSFLGGIALGMAYTGETTGLGLTSIFLSGLAIALTGIFVRSRK